MASDADKNTLLAWCILHIITSCVIIGVIMYHGYRMLTMRDTLKGRTWLVVLDMMAIICFFNHSCYDAVTNILFYVFDGRVVLTDALCHKYGSYRLIVYHLGRFMLYLVWITQIHKSYKGSSYAYSTRFIIAPMYILNIVFIVVCVSFLDFYWLRSHSENGLWCIVEYEWGMLILVALFDVFFSVSTLILFIRPLTKIIKQGQSGSKAEQKDVSKFVHIIAKKTILISITIASSNIFVPFEFFGIPLVPVDDAVNSICVILMLHLYKDLYKRCCGKMENHIWWCCFHQTEDVMEMVRATTISHAECASSPRSVSPSITDTNKPTPDCTTGET